MKQVVDIFRRVGRSFLTPHAGVPLEPRTIVDLSHEALMRCWTRLIAWTQEERESAVSYMRIAQAASWWAESSSGLWIDPQLETGLQWRLRNKPTAAWAERYDSNFALTMDFLDRSEKQREAEQRKEVARKRYWRLAASGFFLVLLPPEPRHGSLCGNRKSLTRTYNGQERRRPEPLARERPTIPGGARITGDGRAPAPNFSKKRRFFTRVF